jgi:glycine cleavage system H protein
MANLPEGTMPEIPADLRYSKDHLWARPGADAGLVRVGVTDFAQQSLGDVVDVTLPEPGETVTAGEACGDIESVKSLSDLIAPVTGTVRARNEDLTGAPELVNTDPYGQGWMFEVETDPATLAQQLTALMDADAYRALAGA